MEEDDSEIESVDDSDADPNFCVEESESSSEFGDERGVGSEEEERSRRGKKDVTLGKRSEKKEDLGEHFDKERPGPSYVRALQLSEGESSSEDENRNEERSRTPQPSTEVSSSDLLTQGEEEVTDYDFSKILECQRTLEKARADRERLDVTSLDIKGPLPGEPSVTELLAIGEKHLPDQDLKELSEESADEEPPKVVEISLKEPIGHKVSSRKQKRAALFEKHLRAVRKENQLLLHKVHLLCLIGHGLYLNSNFVNLKSQEEFLKAQFPKSGYYAPQHVTSAYIKKLLDWFSSSFCVTRDLPVSCEILKITFEERVRGKLMVCYSIKDAVILFVALLRALGFSARFMMSLQPVPLKPKDITTKKSPRKKANDKQIEEESDFSDDDKPSTSKKSTTKKTPKKPTKSEVPRGKLPTKKSKKEKPNSKKKPIKVLSPDREEYSGVDYWAEVYLESEESWISVDLYSQKVNCPHEIYARCTKPVTYILGWLDNDTLKDLTRRYVPSWTTVSKRDRVDKDWWNETVKPFLMHSGMDEIEDEKLDRATLTPMPTKISDFKNHPLYALQRHLLKFEGIYPPNAKPLGFIKREAIYSRFCVHELFSREKWIRQGKCVRVNEKPYKIVKSRSKSEPLIGGEKPLELFGHWQVEDYMAPPVIDGKIPRNEYGNIEVYKPSMLPAGTVHLQIPGIMKVAKKLDIDCAPAVIGWEHHGGRSHPVIDGGVVCKEFQDVLLDAWNAEADASTQRSKHKRVQNVYKKWLKFTKFVIIKANLKRKYNFGEVKPKSDSPPKKGKMNS